MDDSAQLTSDPVFQVNSCLWSVRRASLAPAGGPRPALAQHSYALKALGFRTPPSAAIKEGLIKLQLGPDGPEPDVILKNVQNNSHLVLECKTTSFGPESTTSKQAKKLLAVCADSDSALGVQGDAAVLYVLSQDQAELQLATLATFTEELRSAGMLTAESGTFGLSIDDTGLWAEICIPNPKEDSVFEPVLKRHHIVEGSREEARPLYLIPYDPTVVENQSPEEQKYCSEILAERLCVQAASMIGRSQVPDVVRLSMSEIFSEATFGVSQKWQANELRQLKAKLAKTLNRLLKRGQLKEKILLDKDTVELSLADESDLDAALSMLLKAPIERIAQSFLDPQFDFLATPRQGKQGDETQQTLQD